MIRLLAAILLLAPAGASAFEFSPLYGLSILGGQSFYTGQKGALSGNFIGVFAPAMKLNDRWSLLPSLNSNYQGTEQALDVVGGQTLFQMQWDNRASLRGVYSVPDSDWRLKPFCSFKYEMPKETNDEQLGQGLFDYKQWETGFDAEYVYREPFSLHAGIDYFSTHFPNYTSLESQVATSVGGQSLARELVGNYVIDTQNFLFTVGGNAPLYNRFVVDGGLSVLYSKFPNQHVVDPSGNLTEPLRQDVQTTLAAKVKMPTELNSDLRLLPGLETSFTYLTSDQNSFDASQTQYIPYFYNYGELKLGPSLDVLIGDPRTPIIWSIGADYWHRRYPYRPTQDANGSYAGGAPIHTDNWLLSSSLAYPMASHFNLVFDVQYGRGSSNMHYQQFFTYNYAVTNYMFGFSWDY